MSDLSSKTASEDRPKKRGLFSRLGGRFKDKNNNLESGLDVDEQHRARLQLHLTHRHGVDQVCAAGEVIMQPDTRRRLTGDFVADVTPYDQLRLALGVALGTTMAKPPATLQTLTIATIAYDQVIKDYKTSQALYKKSMSTLYRFSQAFHDSVMLENKSVCQMRDQVTSATNAWSKAKPETKDRRAQELSTAKQNYTEQATKLSTLLDQLPSKKLHHLRAVQHSLGDMKNWHRKAAATFSDAVDKCNAVPKDKPATK